MLCFLSQGAARARVNMLAGSPPQGAFHLTVEAQIVRRSIIRMAGGTKLGTE
jgi:hypothetical protein